MMLLYSEDIARTRRHRVGCTLSDTATPTKQTQFSRYTMLTPRNHRKQRTK